jgi:hypothetical protein
LIGGGIRQDFREWRTNCEGWDGGAKNGSDLFMQSIGDNFLGLLGGQIQIYRILAAGAETEAQT